MILSLDKTKAFFEIPKTGSSTMRSLLLPDLGIDLVGRSPHIQRFAMADLYRNQIDPLATQEELDAIVGYAFWRDPVDRFRSQCSFSRQYPEALMALFPEIFGDTSLLAISKVKVDTKRWDKTEYDKLSKEFRDAVDAITADMFYERVWNRLTINPIMYPQNLWFREGGVIALNFHDYDNEATKLLTLFGGDPKTKIPVKNASAEFLPNLAVPVELEDMIRSIYADDYAFDPR